MSRRHPRLRVRLTATVSLRGSTTVLVCPTRDISESGCYLDTAEPMVSGSVVEIALLDHDFGEAVDLVGVVTRVGERGVGVRLDAPPEGWLGLVARHHHQSSGPIHIGNMARRMRILVVGSDARRRGALALYVTSGWDVRFASDQPGAEEALRSVTLDAVIAEHDIDGDEWRQPLTAAKRSQPNARRIVRCELHGGTTPDARHYGGLIDRVVDATTGMDALFDALTADFGASVGRDAGSTSTSPSKTDD